MKLKHFIYALSFISLAALPQVKAQEGFVFTDEDVAEDSNRDREMQSLISDGVQYLSKARAAYANIVGNVGQYCARINKINDFTNAAGEFSPAALHKQYYNSIISANPFDEGNGIFIYGVLCPSIYEKAKVNLSPAQRQEMEHIMARCEALMKWYCGKLAKLCASHDDDYMDMLQQTARFKENILASKLEEVDKNYDRMWGYFYARNSERYEAVARITSDKGMIRSIARDWINHFGTAPNAAKRDQFIRWVLFADPSYSGPRLNLRGNVNMNGLISPEYYLSVKSGKASFANTEHARYLQYYIAFFDPWTDDYMDSVAELGTYNLQDVEKIVTESEALAGVGGKYASQADKQYEELASTGALYACTTLSDMNNVLVDTMEEVARSRKYKLNVEKTKEAGKTLLQLVDRQIGQVDKVFDNIHKACMEQTR